MQIQPETVVKTVVIIERFERLYVVEATYSSEYKLSDLSGLH